MCSQRGGLSMRIGRRLAAVSTLAIGFAVPLAYAANAVTAHATAYNLPLQHQAATLSSLTPRVSWEMEPLVDFKSSEIKFNLQTLMNTLRDTRHEGWVLAAYPDPKTSRPLIGAGFSLDLEARQHIQRDPLNPYMFLEPSSAQLWEAAGLEPQHADYHAAAI